MAELKLCPFCGGKAVFGSRECRYGYIAWIECETCENQTKAVTSRMHCNEDGFEDTVCAKRIAMKWNRRAHEAD